MKNYTTSFFNFRFSSKISKDDIISDYKNSPLKTIPGVVVSIGTDNYTRGLLEHLIEERVVEILKP